MSALHLPFPDTNQQKTAVYWASQRLLYQMPVQHCSTTVFLQRFSPALSVLQPAVSVVQPALPAGHGYRLPAVLTALAAV